MLLVHSDPSTSTVSIPAPDGESVVVERRADGTFDVPFDHAAALLDWPTWSLAPIPEDPELGGDGGPAPLPPLKDLRKADLQALCQERGLDNDGTNAVLTDRLLAWADARQS